MVRRLFCDLRALRTHLICQPLSNVGETKSTHPPEQARSLVVPANVRRSSLVLFVTAIQEESDALLAVLKAAGATIGDESSHASGHPHHRGTLPFVKEGSIEFLVCNFAGAGELTTTLRLSALLPAEQPCIAIMTGVCAGDPKKVKLGDLLVAKRAVHRSTGKDSAGGQNQADVVTYNVPDAARAWFPTATTALASQFPSLIPKVVVERIMTQMHIMRLLFDHLDGLGGREIRGKIDGDKPMEDSEWDRLFNQQLVGSQLITQDKSTRKWKLSDARREQIDDILDAGLSYPPSSIDSSCHLGTLFASPTTVVASLDDGGWKALAEHNATRSQLGGEMESVGFLASCQDYNEHPSSKRVVPLFVKSVMDFAGSAKCDEWKEYAAHASAAWAVMFVRHYGVHFL